MTDSPYGKLEFVFSRHPKPYRQIAPDEETKAIIRAEERERIVKALEAIWGYEPIATSHPTCMATCYDGTWIKKETAIAIVRGDV